jgi:hypothetical protein
MKKMGIKRSTANPTPVGAILLTSDQSGIHRSLEISQYSDQHGWQGLLAG